MCKDCILTLEAISLPADLIVLSMKEFDIILGIDWLTKYCAKLDCANKMITFLVLGSVIPAFSNIFCIIVTNNIRFYDVNIMVIWSI